MHPQEERRPGETERLREEEGRHDGSDHQHNAFRGHGQQVPTRTIAELFVGFDKAYGQYEIKRANEKGKLEGKASTVQGAVTKELWNGHLAGTGPGLGVIPLLADNTVRWACIDIDKYGINHAELEQKIKKLDLPLIVAKSKSGGAHCLTFFKEPAPAKEVREVLKNYAAALGYGGCEVFPKQTTRDDDGMGNWLNMPYYFAEKTSRYAIKNGKPLTLEEFEAYATERSITLKELVEVEVEAQQYTSGRDKTRSADLFNFVRDLFWAGTSEADIVEQVLALPADHRITQHIADQKQKPVDYVRRQVRKIIEHVESDAKSQPLIERLNSEFAVVLVGGSTVVMRFEDDKTNFALMNVDAFNNWTANWPPMRSNSGQQLAASRFWMRHPRRRQYRGIEFTPSGGRRGFYNLWKGFTVEPRPGDCSKFLAHLRDNVAGSDEFYYRWVVGWFAHLIQHPAKKSGTSLVIKGAMGTGKTIVGQIVGSLFNEHYLLVAKQRHITGTFNSHMASLLLLQADEAFWAGDHEAEGVLKDLVTGHEHLIEHKGKDPVRIANHVRLLVTSNNDFVVPAGMAERRFAIRDIGEDHKDDKAYFRAIVNEIENGGREALLHHLLNVDLNLVDVTTIPKTQELLEQKIRNLTPEQGWWLDILTRGELPGSSAENMYPANECPCDMLFNNYIHHAQQIGVRRRALETSLGMFLRKAVPGLRRRRRVISEDGAQTPMYVFASLAECRQKFSQTMQTLGSWGASEDWGGGGHEPVF
jgi:hypothetical protein